MTSQHLILAAKSWVKFSLEEQMGNIGSEVSRAIRAKGDKEYYWGAVSRALELFYLTIIDPRWKGRLKEIVRAKELFCAAALGNNEYNTTLEDLDRYFTYFALVARATSCQKRY
ncbi:MAG: hypothetical protein A3E80_05990 [Chlamydiae bacterium RIFCSPHIGHO2_12_FULL_49_9]|nr:MAG: hypothetical protein A3E80_05990 [Chlamydiae bacterium RIFCSPHIGHO2_12_FULL_49_9]